MVVNKENQIGVIARFKDVSIRRPFRYRKQTYIKFAAGLAIKLDKNKENLLYFPFSESEKIATGLNNIDSDNQKGIIKQFPINGSEK